MENFQFSGKCRSQSWKTRTTRCLVPTQALWERSLLSKCEQETQSLSSSPSSSPSSSSPPSPSSALSSLWSSPSISLSYHDHRISCQFESIKVWKLKSYVYLIFTYDRNEQLKHKLLFLWPLAAPQVFRFFFILYFWIILQVHCRVCDV